MSRRRLALLAVAAVLVVLFGGRWIALQYTEGLWFEDLGQGARFRSLLLRGFAWQAGTFLVAFAWFAAHTLGVYASIGAVHLPRRLGNLEIDEAVPARVLRLIALGTAALLAFATAYTFGDLDEYVALARAAAPFGYIEPILHQDTSFYLAVLPLLEVLHLLASVLTVLASMLVIGLYAITGSFAIARRRIRITPHARTHLVILLAALAMVVAWGFHIDAYQLVAGGGHANGALSPTDRVIRIPASHALAVLSLAVAAGSALALRWVRPGMLFGLWALLGISTLLGRLIIPAMTEAWGGAGDAGVVTELNQLTDRASRDAFGLQNAALRALPTAPPGADSSTLLADAVNSLYAWNDQVDIAGRLLDEAQHDTSGLRRWSLTPVIARDRSGAQRPAALGVSQTDFAKVMRAVPRPRWESLHRGPMAWGGAPVAFDGAPRTTWAFLSSLAPAESAAAMAPLAGGPARVRFLPGVAELGVIGAEEPSSGGATPGIVLGSLPRRILLGWALQSPPLLDDHTNTTDRVLYWRDVPSRLAHLYPFAGFDPARGAMLDGRLTWIVDGYLLSARYPLAEPVRWRGEDVNYLASPYVVTVDAVTGVTRMYLRPGANPFAASLPAAFHATALPSDSMPASLRAAMRYPEGLLGAQAMTIAQRGERDERGSSWSVAWPDTTEATHDALLLRSTVAVTSLGGESPRMWQFIPVVDRRSEHLAALVAATVGAGGDLQIVQLRIDPGTLPTPEAASLHLAGTPAVAAGSLLPSSDRVLRGQILVAPAGGGVVYAQMFFSTGRAGSAARVEGVAVLAGNRTGFGSDARAAVRSLQRGEGESMGGALASADLGDARAAFLALDSARLSGDWERFGRAWAALRRALHLEPAAPPAAPLQLRP